MTRTIAADVVPSAPAEKPVTTAHANVHLAKPIVQGFVWTPKRTAATVVLVVRPVRPMNSVATAFVAPFVSLDKQNAAVFVRISRTTHSTVVLVERNATAATAPALKVIALLLATAVKPTVAGFVVT